MMTIIISSVLGLTIGGIVAWLIASSRLSKQIVELDGKAKSTEAVSGELRQQIEQKDSEINQIRSELDTERQLKAKLEESQKYLQEEKAKIEEMREELTKTFKSLSLDALTENSKEFLKLAEKALETKTVEGKKELDSKKEIIDNTLKEMDKTLSDVRKRIEDVGKGNVEVSTLIKKHEDVTSKLKETTEHLKQALASSKKRGEWGERMAEDIIKLIGMVEGINYIKQKT
jgi:DNA recombination protein RmuC